MGKEIDNGPDDLIGYLQWRREQWEAISKKPAPDEERARYQVLVQFAERARELVGHDNVYGLTHHEKAQIDSDFELLVRLRRAVDKLGSNHLDGIMDWCIRTTVRMAQLLPAIRVKQ